MIEKLRAIQTDIVLAQRAIVNAREKCERGTGPLGSIIWSLDWAETELDKVIVRLHELEKAVQS